MKLKITQEDIDNGIKTSASKCPVALAVERTIESEDYYMIAVTGTRVKVYESMSRLKELYGLDEDGVDFILNFDKGKTVKPCEINLIELYKNDPLN